MNRHQPVKRFAQFTLSQALGDSLIGRAIVRALVAWERVSMVVSGERGLAAMGVLALAFAWSIGGLREARADIPPAAAVQLPAYYNPGDLGPFAPLIFMRQGPPPADDSVDKTTYALGPITDSIAQNVTPQNNSTWTGGHEWPSVWVNRARVPRGQVPIEANPIFPVILDPKGNQYRLEYTTVARADAATKAEVLYIMGAPPSVWQAPLTTAGIGSVAWAPLAADPDAWFTVTSQDGNSKVMVDKMVIPTTVSTSAYGFRIDYEVLDHRSPSDAHAFLDDLSATIRSYGLKVFLYTNPMDVADSYGIQANGFDFNRMDDLKAHFDYISLYVWGGQGLCLVNPSYSDSVTFLKGVSGKLNFKQIIVLVDLFYCSVAEAGLIADQRAIDNFAGYVINNDGAIDGGSTLTGSNLVIWRLLHPDGD